MSWDSGALLFGGLGSCASRIIRDTRRPVHGMPSGWVSHPPSSPPYPFLNAQLIRRFFRRHSAEL